jgi:hypothetical protein
MRALPVPAATKQVRTAAARVAVASSKPGTHASRTPVAIFLVPQVPRYACFVRPADFQLKAAAHLPDFFCTRLVRPWRGGILNTNTVDDGKLVRRGAHPCVLSGFFSRRRGNSGAKAAVV